MIPVTVSLQLPGPLLLELLAFLRGQDDEPDLSQAATDALRNWLDQQTRTPPSTDQSQTRGYWWKSLFLPEGSKLKKFLRPGHDCAVVEGDRLMYEGRPVSPNQFAGLFSGCVRNAWRDLAVWSPDDRKWKYAHVRRRELQREQARHAAEAATRTPAPTPPQTCAPAGATTCDDLEFAASPPSQHAAGAASNVPATPAMRDRGAGNLPNWDLPERRKTRYRREDVGFE